jgi:hypothetical protein
MCFPGGGSSDNSAMINLEKQQAEEARQKEAARQTRIQQGLEAIKLRFEGKDTTKTVKGKPVKFTGKGFKEGGAVTGLPAGYTYATQMEGAVAPTSRQVTQQVGGGGGGGTRNVSSTVQVPGKPGTAVQYVKGPDGKLYKVGETITPTSVVKTGHTGGFDKGFYDKFRRGILDYYTPDVQSQYGDASKEMTYRLARAGILKSSAANTEFADLARQRGKATVDIANKADTETGKVKQNVLDTKKSITSQLYATENPDVATSQALDATNKISLDEGDRSPLADIFKLAAVGGAGFGQGYNNQRYMSQIPGVNSRGASRVVTA